MTGLKGGSFGQIPLSGCIGYDAPHSIMQLAYFANVKSGIQCSIERSDKNLNVYGHVSGTYTFVF